ncbi:MAG: hypothetical protein RLY86_1474 [Pseudomonadota bacterium]|jgi:anti-sigma factor RsiW
MTEIKDQELQSYLDGALDPDSEAELQARLADDLEAQDRLQAFAVDGLLLRIAVAGSRQAPALPAADPGTRGRAGAAGHARPLRSWMGRAAAMVVAGCLGWVANDIVREVAPGLPTYAQEALHSHEAFAAPAEAAIERPAGNRSEVIRWLTSKLGEPADVPELRMIGLDLIGVRLVGMEEGVGAQLIYQDSKGERLSIALAPDELTAPEDLTVAEHDGFVVGYWRGQRFAYALVARSTPLQVAEIASAVGAPRN